MNCAEVCRTRRGSFDIHADDRHEAERTSCIAHTNMLQSTLLQHIGEDDATFGQLLLEPRRSIKLAIFVVCSSDRSVYASDRDRV